MSLGTLNKRGDWEYPEVEAFKKRRIVKVHRRRRLVGTRMRRVSIIPNKENQHLVEVLLFSASKARPHNS